MKTCGEIGMKVKIGNKLIGEGEPCFIIAEAGSNHNGSLEQAQRMVDVAKEAGADAIKFQIFRAKKMYPNKPIDVRYLEDIGIKEDLYNLIKKLEVPYDWIQKLHMYCEKVGIEFMATPSDLEAVRLLDTYVSSFKIASYESLFFDLIEEIKKTKKPILISTGGSTEEEIDTLMRDGLNDYKDETVLLHCVARYPAPLEETTLDVIPYLAKKYNVCVGYSDHSANPIIAPVVAVALGAKVIEKHFTLSRKLPGPDHIFAIEPDELKEMVKSIRMAEKSISHKAKRVLQKCEKELYYYKRCLYCNRDLPKGHRISKTDIVILRNTGIECNYFNPFECDMVVGKTLKRSKKAMDIITKEDVK